MSRVLLIQHDAAEPPGRIGDALRAANVGMTAVHTYAAERVPASLEEFHGLIVMGGPMDVYEADRYPHLRDEILLVRDALSRELPLLGICLGSQILASALGTPVVPGPVKEIGWLPIELTAAAEDDPLFAGIRSGFTALSWHKDTFLLPPGAVHLASSARTEVQAFRYGKAAWGTLFHLETTEKILAAMTAAFADELRAERIPTSVLKAEARRFLPPLEKTAATILGRFTELLAG